MAEQQKRQIAYKTRIVDLSEGKYVKEEGWNPNYVESKGRKVSRANIIGTIVAKENVDSFQSLTVDDGTGSISARSFEKIPVIDELSIGDVVLIIGRPREYGNEIYLLIEIIKKIENHKWILYRKAELDNQPEYEKKEEEKEVKAEKKEETVTEESVVEEKVVEKNIEESAAEKILKRIKELDKGEGADFEEVVSGIENGEKTISSLLTEGEIFELKPGKLKVLE